MRATTARPLVVGLLLVVASLGLTGCRAVKSTIDLESALERDGFGGVSVDLESSGNLNAVNISAARGPGVESADAAPRQRLRAAEITWRTFPYRFDVVTVSLGGGSAEGFPYGRLLNEFGPRPSRFDQRSIDEEFERVGRTAIIVLALGGLVGVAFVVAVVVIIVVVVRRRRPPQPAGWPPGSWTGPQPGWPPQQPPPGPPDQT